MHRIFRNIAGVYPFQIGKGWVARLSSDQDIPDGEVVETRDGILVKTAPDYAFKHVYLFKEFEPVNTAAFRRLVRPGTLCLDIGANFGYFTCLFAKWGARVHAFEPMPSTFALNLETVKLNQLESFVSSHNCGMGEKEGTLRIYRFRNLSHGHASSCDLDRDDAISEDCRITTLDNFCSQNSVGRIHFIKIDVEGFEFEVLKGGKWLLSDRMAPTVHFEVNGECMEHRKMDPNQIVLLLKSYGYTKFLQIKRYGGMQIAPVSLPVSNYDYLAFKDEALADEILRG